MWPKISTLISLFLFVGCMSTRGERAWLSRFSRVNVRPLATELATLQCSQQEMVAMTYQDRTMTFESVFSANAAGATWIWLLPTARALTLRIAADGTWTLEMPPEAKDPPIAANLILDLAVRHFSHDTLQRLLPELDVVDSPGERRLLRHGETIILLKNDTISHPQLGYSIQFKPLT